MNHITVEANLTFEDFEERVERRETVTERDRETEKREICLLNIWIVGVGERWHCDVLRGRGGSGFLRFRIACEVDRITVEANLTFEDFERESRETE